MGEKWKKLPTVGKKWQEMNNKQQNIGKNVFKRDGTGGKVA